MPNRKEGGYTYRDLMEWAADGESDDLDGITEALILLMTKQPEQAAEVLQRVSKHIKQRMTMHRYLESNKVLDAANLVWGDKPLLDSKQGKTK